MYLELIPGVASKTEQARAGIMLAFKKSLNVEILDKSAHEAWCVIVKYKIHGKIMVIANFYTHSLTTGGYSEKLDKLNSWLTKFKNDNVILMGDFNCTLSKRDNSKIWSETHQSRALDLEALIDKWDMQDVWRIHHPFDTQFTHIGRPGQNCACIDHVFASLDFSTYFSDCSIGVSYCSDHSPLHFEFSFEDTPGKGYNKFPVDLCYSDVFHAKLEENWKRVSENNLDAKPDILLYPQVPEQFKCFIFNKLWK